MTTPANPQNERLTRYVADFICDTRLADHRFAHLHPVGLRRHHNRPNYYPC